MHSEHDEMLREVAEGTLEELAFVLAVPDEDACQPPGVTAGIRFRGPFDGALFITVSPQMLPVVAANMLGVTDNGQLSTECQHDAFKELLNVICGNLLPVYAGDGMVFDVDSADMLAGRSLPEELDGRPPVATASLVLDAGRAELAFFTAAQQSARTVRSAQPQR